VSQRAIARGVLTAAITLLGAVSAADAQETYRIIVNKANPAEALTKGEIARFFLTHATWDSGEPVQPVDLAAGSPVREDFSRDVLGMTAAGAIRQRQRIGDPPPSLASDREVLAYVRLKRAAIGYVSPTATLIGVKVIAIVQAPERTAAGRPGAER
jgi:hypothetical protein